MAGIRDYKIMMVGVVPPPVHGQSMATQALFSADLAPIHKIIVEVRSSRIIASVGRASLIKALGLVLVIFKTWLKWLRYRPKVLYYTAGSGAWVPFSRDLLFLGLCRPLFARTVIHYHSGDLVDFLARSPIHQTLGKFIYGRKAWTIRLGEPCPAPTYVGSKVINVPNGIDVPGDLPLRCPSDSFRILFLGNLFEDKGVIDLLSAVHIVAARDSSPILLSLVGGWPNSIMRDKVEALIAALPAHVTCPPPRPVYGAEKWEVLSNQDVLVFPTHYSKENLPLVIIEAMAASLPVISTCWRGIPALTQNHETGLLVPISDPVSIAKAIQTLKDDPVMMERLGKEAQRRYRKNFTLAHYIGGMRRALVEAVESLDSGKPEITEHKAIRDCK